jgi:hypothetical protein
MPAVSPLNLQFATELPEIANQRKSQMNHHNDGPQGVARKRAAAASEMRIASFHQTVGGQGGFSFRGLNSNQQSMEALPNAQRSPGIKLPPKDRKNI